MVRRGNSPGVTSVDGLVSGSSAVDLDIAVDPNNVSKDGLPLIDADTFSKLLAEVSLRFHHASLALGMMQALSKLTEASWRLLSLTNRATPPKLLLDDNV